jgi:radical SAM protein with 4Fe4S-binding SPASM domain
MLRTRVACSTSGVFLDRTSRRFYNADMAFDAMQQIDRVFLELANRCNLDCQFCASGISTRPRRDLDKDLACELIDQLNQLGYREAIYFHVLGEPLLHPGVFEIVNHAAERGMRPVLFTNGAALTGEVVERGLRSKAEEIVISMQTMTRAAYEKLRRAPVGWDEYVSGIRRALGLAHDWPPENGGPGFRVCVGVKKQEAPPAAEPFFVDYESPEEFRAGVEAIFAEVEGVDLGEVWRGLEAHGRGGFGPVQVAARLSVLVREMGNWRDLWRETPVKSGRCRFLGRELAILSNGTVTLCHLDYDGRAAIGTVADRSLSEIVADPAFGEMMAAGAAGTAAPEECHYCRALRAEE